MLTLITGGARSGKSSFAQSLCANAAAVTYVATAYPEDDEMRNRIRHHQQSRPKGWTVLEEPLAIADAVRAHASRNEFVLLDCITVWLSNYLFAYQHEDEAETDRKAYSQISDLIGASLPGRVIVVTNELGCGIVPDSALARRFRDLHGFVNQQLARAANYVYLAVSGIPVRIKPTAGEA